MTQEPSAAVTVAESDRDRTATRADELVARSDEIGTGAHAQMAAVRADTRLSNEGKAESIKNITEAANTQRAELDAQHLALLTERRDTLRRSLCSPPAATSGLEAVSTAASYRDALQRAQSTDVFEARELTQLMSLAQMTGDALLERAAMVVALERGNTDVVGAWSTSHPADAVRLDELTSLQRDLTSADRIFRRALNFVSV